MTSADDHPSKPGDPALGALDGAAYLLLDFDGPVCRLYANRPSENIAAMMRGFLADRGFPFDGIDPLRRDDPHHVLRAPVPRAIRGELEELLAAEEELAAQSAEPTPGAGEFVQAVAASGRVLAVTTNNAPAAVGTYLKAHGLQDCFDGRIFGRDPRDPELMKPHPDCLLRALDHLGAPADACLMVGDSPMDAVAARAAGVRFLGCAHDAERAGQVRRAAGGWASDVVAMTDLRGAARRLAPRRG